MTKFHREIVEKIHIENEDDFKKQISSNVSKVLNFLKQCLIESQDRDISKIELGSFGTRKSIFLSFFELYIIAIFRAYFIEGEEVVFRATISLKKRKDRFSYFLVVQLQNEISGNRTLLVQPFNLHFPKELISFIKDLRSLRNGRFVH